MAGARTGVALVRVLSEILGQASVTTVGTAIPIICGEFDLQMYERIQVSLE